MVAAMRCADTLACAHADCRETNVCRSERRKGICQEHRAEHLEAARRRQAAVGALAGAAAGWAIGNSEPCPVCKGLETLEANDKAASRQSRLAENGEAMFEDLRWCVGILRREGYTAAADRIQREVLSKIEATPEEGK